MGESSLRGRLNAVNAAGRPGTSVLGAQPEPREGSRSRFRHLDMDFWHGNVTECGDVGTGPGRSCLFLLTVHNPGNGLAGEGVLGLEEAGSVARSGALVTALENPQEGVIFMPGRTDNRSRSPR